VRTAILDAAEQVLAREGLGAGRMEDIARRAGVAVGTVYNHFADRDTLLRSLLQSRRGELLGRVDRALASADPGFRKQLTAFVSAVFEHARSHQSLLALLVQDQGVALKARLEPSPETRALNQLRARARRIVARGVAEGVIRRKGSALWADLLVGAVRALLLRELERPGEPRQSAPVQPIVDFFLTGAGDSHGRASL
jgi:AcrR family transcriptional regulator